MIKGGFAFLVFIFLMGFASASVQTGNLSHSIEKEYVFGESITGWINFSLTNHPVDAILNTSFGAINLVDLIYLNPSFQKTCNPSDCMQTYKTTDGGAASKEFTLNRGESKVLGFNFTGNEVQITTSKFSASVTSAPSGAAETESQALKIDLLDDGDYDWVPYTASGTFSDKSYGCYSTSTSAVSITSSKYCNKIALSNAPNFKIGANVIASAGGSVPFLFTIRDMDNVEMSSCEATATASGEISCIANASNIESGNYYTCIETKTSSGNDKYTINSEMITPCGYATTPNNKRDFEIFAQKGKYEAIGTFILNDNETRNANTDTIIEGEINDYIAEKYNGNCESGCVVPVRFFSGLDGHKITVSQEIAGKEFVSYSSSGVSGEKIMNLHDTSLTPATMSSGFQKLSLDEANFSIPESFGKKSFFVKIDGTTIFTENITIERTAQINSIFPETTAAAYPTFFTVEVDEAPNLTISKYHWDFGDEQAPETTTENGVEHTYNSIGNFDLTVTVTNSNGENSSKIFTVNVESPKNAVESLLQQDLDSLSSITASVQEMPLAYQSAVSQKINLDELNSALTGLQQRSLTATQDDDYVSIMAEILGLIVPLSFTPTESADMAIFYPKEESVDADIVKGITGESYNSNNRQGYSDAILRFNLDNLKALMNFNDYSAVYSDGNTENIVKTFQLNLGAEPKLKDSYFIVKKLGEMTFEDNYEQKEKNGYYYIMLTGEDQTIGFSTTDEVGFNDLPAFVSPAISELQLSSAKPGEGFNPNKINFAGVSVTKQTLFVIMMVLLIFVAGIIYVVLQQWYKKKYEDYLFKNKNDLYNVVSYVQNMKKQNVDDSKVESGLKKSGWNSEQIRYIMKKYYGKKTGL